MYSEVPSPSTVDSPRIDITPELALMDEQVQIHVLHCAPHQRITLAAQMTDDGGWHWTSRAVFEADATGTVDLAAQAPLEGSYSGIDPTGLFWSMTPDVHKRGMDYFGQLQPYRTTLTAEVAERVIATAQVERTFGASDLITRSVREQGLVGTLFHPEAPGAYPGVLVLGGSEGGLPNAMAALLASRGYATLALAYHKVEPLPTTLVNIPLEYFATALAWMSQQTVIRAGQLAVVGVSKGGELALLLGATFPSVKAVVGYVASGVVYQGLDMKHKISSWSSQGQSVPFVPYYYTTGMALRSVWNAITRTPTPLLPVHSGYLSDQRIVEQATIPVERIQGPVLLLSGQDDQVWPSSALAEMVMKRLKEHHHPYEDRHVCYEDAGHFLLALPSLPTRLPALLAGILGGTPQGNARAAADGWSQMLRFLQEHFA